MYDGSHDVWLVPMASAFEACDMSGGTELASASLGGGSSTANLYEAVVTTAGSLFIVCQRGSHCSAG